MRLTDGQNSHR